MTKSKNNLASSSDMTDAELVEHYKNSAFDGLLYWMNSTTSLLGRNASLTILTEMLATAIENLIPEDQITRAEDVIFNALEESFDRLKESAKVVPSKKGNDSLN